MSRQTGDTQNGVKEVTITLDYETGAFIASAEPPITLEDQIILFSNDSDAACQIVFEHEAAFGINGITIGPGSAFTLVYRGIETEFRLMKLPEFPVPAPTRNPTIPPGSLIRRKKS
jgi:hypothetical protein